MSDKIHKPLYVIQMVKNDHSIVGYCGKKASQFLAIPCSVADDQFITDYLYTIKHLKQYKSRIAAERFVSKRSLTLKNSYHLNVIELPHAVIDAMENGLPFTGCPKCGSLIIQYKLLLPWYNYKKFNKETGELIPFENINDYPQEGGVDGAIHDNVFCADCGYCLQDYNV